MRGGGVQVMAERYQRLRLEVQTANDSGQRGRTYADLARRVVKAENKAANAAFAPLARVPGGSCAGVLAAGANSLQATRQSPDFMQSHEKRRTLVTAFKGVQQSSCQRRTETFSSHLQGQWRWRTLI